MKRVRGLEGLSGIMSNVKAQSSKEFQSLNDLKFGYLDFEIYLTFGF